MAAFFILTLLGLVAGFNYKVDPFCYYCDEIPTHRTLNRYYQAAQLVLQNPDTEQILLGSSRGETTSALWLQRITGLKTLNLSTAGAELLTKEALLKVALKNASIKRVIWYADYFELITSNTDTKIKNSKALMAYISESGFTSRSWSEKLGNLQQLIDHNTIEASFAALKLRPASGRDQGPGSDIDYSACESPTYKGKETPESLRHEVDLIYENYVNGSIKPPQNPKALEHFKQLIQELQTKSVKVVIVIPPYHPDFVERLKKEHPEIYQAHLQWVQNIETLQGPGVEVKNYFAGIPHDDQSPRYWNDGVHFTCKGVIKMMAGALNQ